MYIYKTSIFKSSTLVIGIDPNNVANLSDFETNFKATARKIDELLLSGNSFVIELSYTDFKAKITGSVLWSDVKYIETSKYLLHLLTDNPL